MRRHAGFTIVELMIAISILAVLTSILIPYYQDYRYKIKVHQAVVDILSIEVLIQGFYNDNRDYPNSLSDVGAGTRLDPWGNTYRYLDITKEKGKGKVRRDKSLNPINSDYDLYSMGKDGQSSYPITAKASLDDIIRARNGQFVDLASTF